MKSLYLDYNIYVNLISSNESITKLIKQLSHLTYFPVYSPAHIEEVAVARIRNDYPLDKTKEKLTFISKFTKDYELLPFERKDTRVIHRNGIFLCEENPLKCYERVVKDYSRNDYAEKVDKQVLEDAESLKIFDNDPFSFNNTAHDSVLTKHKGAISQTFIEAMKRGYGETYTLSDVNSFQFSDIKNNFKIFETLMNVIFNYIEHLRFFPENKKNSRSRLHDVTHAIYAPYTDLFVSGDNKLINKMLVAYKYLDVELKIMQLIYNKKNKTHELKPVN